MLSAPSNREYSVIFLINTFARMFVYIHSTASFHSCRFNFSLLYHTCTFISRRKQQPPLIPHFIRDKRIWSPVTFIYLFIDWICNVDTMRHVRVIINQNRFKWTAKKTIQLSVILIGRTSHQNRFLLEERGSGFREASDVFVDHKSEPYERWSFNELSTRYFDRFFLYWSNEVVKTSDGNSEILPFYRLHSQS